MGTTLLDALDFSWNHTNDWVYQIQNQNLSIAARAGKIISDCAVYLFALLLRANTTEKIANRRISFKTAEEYTQYVSTNSMIKLCNQSVILVLNGELDIPTSPENFKRLETESGCKVKFLKVRHLEEIKFEIETLKQSNNKIEALWIRAHGTPFSISFNHYDHISLDNLDFQIEDSRRFLQEQLKQLEQKAPIILESCFTGKEVEIGKKNVAQFIASTAGGRKVYAPSREALPIGENIIYTPEKGFKVVINSFQSSTYFTKGSCLSRICAIWHAYRDHVEEITCEF